MVEEITRCTRCILPSSYPNIDFDKKGECRVCRRFDEFMAELGCNRSILKDSFPGYRPRKHVPCDQG